MVAAATDEREERLAAQRRTIALLEEAVRLKDRLIDTLEERIFHQGRHIAALKATAASLDGTIAALRERLVLAEAE